MGQSKRKRAATTLSRWQRWRYGSQYRLCQRPSEADMTAVALIIDHTLPLKVLGAYNNTFPTSPRPDIGLSNLHKDGSESQNPSLFTESWPWWGLAPGSTWQVRQARTIFRC
ncbi:MAG: hypothetical protein AAGD23_09720 [Pseudomonadota bacterium]